MTRDKIQAARRHGKWTGGQVSLGYRVDPERRGLVIIPEEAELVRMIFDLYLQTHSITYVMQRLNAQGLTTKKHVSKSGRVRGGRTWNKNAVYKVLRNPLYIGKIRGADGELHEGEHDPIVSAEAFESVAASMGTRSTGRLRRNRKPEYLLTGLLHCGPCDAGMTSSHATARGGKRYRYYRCVNQQNNGGHCPSGLLPAAEIEDAVIEKVKEITTQGEIRQKILDRFFRDAGLWTEAETTREKLRTRVEDLKAESKRLIVAFRHAGEGGGKTLANRLGEIEAEVDKLRLRQGEVEDQLKVFSDAKHHAERVADLLDGFKTIWDALVPEEQRELLHLLIDRIVVDPKAGGFRIAFHEVRVAPPVLPAVTSDAEEATL